MPTLGKMHQQKYDILICIHRRFSLFCLGPCDSVATAPTRSRRTRSLPTTRGAGKIFVKVSRAIRSIEQSMYKSICTFCSVFKRWRQLCPIWSPKRTRATSTTWTKRTRPPTRLFPLPRLSSATICPLSASPTRILTSRIFNSNSLFVT